MTRIGITGNPGVGKHTVSKLLSKKKGLSIIDINKIIISNHAFITKNSKMEINLKKARELIKDQVKNENIIIVGHLLPYLIRKKELDFVIILRRSPYSLIEEYKRRNYSIQKIQENIAGEILGICFYDTLKVFGKKKISEIDTTRSTPEETMKNVIYSHEYKSERKLSNIDWLEMVYKNGDIQRFLEF